MKHVHITTKREYPEIWADRFKLEMVVNLFVSYGVRAILEEHHIGHGIVGARCMAQFALYFEECIAIFHAKTKAVLDLKRVAEFNSKSPFDFCSCNHVIGINSSFAQKQTL